jgi:hypothetical protein
MLFELSQFSESARTQARVRAILSMVAYEAAAAAAASPTDPAVVNSPQLAVSRQFWANDRAVVTAAARAVINIEAVQTQVVQTGDVTDETLEAALQTALPALLVLVSPPSI